MLAHAARNPAAGSRGKSHVTAVAHVPPATSLIWSHIIRTENYTILFGYERLFVTPHPIGQRLCFAHVGIEGVCGGFTNDREDDCSDSRGITGFGASDMHCPRLEVEVVLHNGSRWPLWPQSW